MREKSLEFWRICDKTLERSSNHGVLSHQDDRGASKRRSDLVHLLRADIVDADDEDGLVLVEQALQLVEVNCFCAGLAPHVFLRSKLGCLRASRVVCVEIDSRVL